MPWGWECRDRLIKQNPAKPTIRRGDGEEFILPGPGHYEPPQIFCGNGFSKIKRSPAYTFGLQTPVQFLKPAAKANAPMLNIQGKGRKGTFRIPGSVVTPHIEPVSDKTKVPGPGAYDQSLRPIRRREPAYSIRIAAKPPYQPWDQWTPPPNMYCPPIPGKRPPEQSLIGKPKDDPIQDFPGPGEHNVNYNSVENSSPKFSFGAPFRHISSLVTPPPNAYCEKLFMLPKPSIPAPTFGIKHSPYIGQQEEYLRSTDTNVATT